MTPVQKEGNDLPSGSEELRKDKKVVEFCVGPKEDSDDDESDSVKPRQLGSQKRRRGRFSFGEYFIKKII